ncbi:TetR/AcrR family transcriptional regulator [Pelagimonas varians]|uniref:Tetracycline repressor protein class A from transposon 1721 n=1 Tax=Pelagimonas varians TaxID=696760 RepID=A0A238KV07_9RHOB|nr:TetR/AcrR family transcriptional regulator [Pelagimonas varians]PYG28344.1 TetR family transcriptional regulator [Pelagimonas varians]SMX46537.1 Tetracycline repressor protein class A from transposon 1721 [Pelagimonas varians]
MTTATKPNDSEAAWLDAAYDMLTENGVDAVKVMPLAKRLGVSRTGFYWHFKDRDALLDAMVQRWEDKNTGNLVARTEAYAETIAEAMFNLFDCWLDDTLFDAKLDLAIRNWARNDPALQTRLSEADQTRARAVQAMFERFGFTPAQAEARAMTVVYTQIGYISMQVFEDRESRIERMPDYVEVYTGQPVQGSDIKRFFSRQNVEFLKS